MQSIDVFISYKREERSLADQVARALKEAGYVAVTDLNIQKATDFGEAIDGMIRAAKVVVVLWTKDSAASKWVRTEAIEGHAQGKYLGVRVDPVSSDDLPIEVRRSNWLDVSGSPMPNGLPALLGEVERLAGRTVRNAVEAETVTQSAEKDLEFYQVVSEIGDIGGFRKYLQIYPNGAYTEDAKVKIEGITSERDQAAYKDAKETGAVGGYRKYIERFPKGAFSQDAHAFVRRNTGWRAVLRRVPIFAIVGATGTVVGVYVALSGVFVEKSPPTAPVSDGVIAGLVAGIVGQSGNTEAKQLRDELNELQARYEELKNRDENLGPLSAKVGPIATNDNREANNPPALASSALPEIWNYSGPRAEARIASCSIERFDVFSTQIYASIFRLSELENTFDGKIAEIENTQTAISAELRSSGDNAKAQSLKTELSEQTRDADDHLEKMIALALSITKALETDVVFVKPCRENPQETGWQ